MLHCYTSRSPQTLGRHPKTRAHSQQVLSQKQNSDPCPDKDAARNSRKPRASFTWRSYAAAGLRANCDLSTTTDYTHYVTTLNTAGPTNNLTSLHSALSWSDRRHRHRLQTGKYCCVFLKPVCSTAVAVTRLFQVASGALDSAIRPSVWLRDIRKLIYRIPVGDSWNRSPRSQAQYYLWPTRTNLTLFRFRDNPLHSR